MTSQRRHQALAPERIFLLHTETTSPDCITIWNQWPLHQECWAINNNSMAHKRLPISAKATQSTVCLHNSLVTKMSGTCISVNLTIAVFQVTYSKFSEIEYFHDFEICGMWFLYVVFCDFGAPYSLVSGNYVVNISLSSYMTLCMSFSTEFHTHSPLHASRTYV